MHTRWAIAEGTKNKKKSRQPENDADKCCADEYLLPCIVLSVTSRMWVNARMWLWEGGQPMCPSRTHPIPHACASACACPTNLAIYLCVDGCASMGRFEHGSQVHAHIYDMGLNCFPSPIPSLYYSMTTKGYLCVWTRMHVDREIGIKKKTKNVHLNAFYVRLCTENRGEARNADGIRVDWISVRAARETPASDWYEIENPKKGTYGYGYESDEPMANGPTQRKTFPIYS